MLAKGSILVIGADVDWTQVVAEQLRRQLHLTAKLADNWAAAEPWLADAVLAVADSAPESPACPVVTVDAPPIRLAELLARVALMCRKAEEDNIAFGPYRLRLREKQLTYADTRADLTDKEVQLLQYLAEVGSEGAGKEQLLRDIWGFEAALDTHTLETHIYRLRGKLRELAGKELIAAVEGGYKLEGIWGNH